MVTMNHAKLVQLSGCADLASHRSILLKEHSSEDSGVHLLNQILQVLVRRQRLRNGIEDTGNALLLLLGLGELSCAVISPLYVGQTGVRVPVTHFGSAIGIHQQEPSGASLHYRDGATGSFTYPGTRQLRLGFGLGLRVRVGGLTSLSLSARRRLSTGLGTCAGPGPACGSGGPLNCNLFSDLIRPDRLPWVGCRQDSNSDSAGSARDRESESDGQFTFSLSSGWSDAPSV